VINKEILDKFMESGNQQFLESVTSEVKKIQTRRKDLNLTMQELTEKRKKLQEESDKKIKEFEQIELTIKNKLQPIIEVHSKNLEKFLEIKDNKARLNLIVSDIKELNIQKEYYEKSIKEAGKRRPPLPKRIIAENYYESFSNQLSEILKTWGLKYKSISYNKEENDVKLDDKIRTEFGKGLRAVIRSAFMVGLIRHCQTKGTPHPAFLILDSPLTAYKGQDKGKTEEEIPKDIETLFFNSLEEYAKSKEFQIIVLDNKEPPAEVLSKIKYTHYSGTEFKKPAGFYPNKTEGNSNI
jgi:hypothetical protein